VPRKTYSEAIGRTRRTTTWLDPASIDRMTDLFDLPRDTTSGTLPVPWHWVYFFSESVANSRIGRDGHPARGDFLPAIHYDADYARDVERYPGIVVHGPLTATRLALLAARMTGEPVTWFSFRGKAPVFVEQPIQLIGRSEKNGTIALRAIRCDGAVAMEATARTGYASPAVRQPI